MENENVVSDFLRLIILGTSNLVAAQCETCSSLVGCVGTQEGSSICVVDSWGNCWYSLDCCGCGSGITDPKEEELKPPANIALWYNIINSMKGIQYVIIDYTNYDKYSLCNIIKDININSLKSKDIINDNLMYTNNVTLD